MPEFPGSVVTLVKTHVALMNLGPSATATVVLGRPLRPSDPDTSVGTWSQDWTPDENSHETGQSPPTLAKYLYHVQLLVKHANEEEGRELHSALSKSLRTMLYQNQDFRVALTQLSETSEGFHERVQHYGVARQQFFSNELRGQFIFLSNLTFWVEVESVPE